MVIFWRIFFVVVFCEIGFALHMPRYMKACGRNDPNINECALQSGINAIPHLVKGDSTYKTPAMNPMFIELVNFQATANINMTLYNVTVMGLDIAELRDVKISIPEKTVKLTIFTKRLEIVGKYSMSGHILILPLDGRGNGNITYIDGTYQYNFKYQLKKKNNIEYAEIANHTLTFDCKRAYYQFDNLFNGNDQIAKQVQGIFSENWRQVHKDFGPLLGDAIGRISTMVIDSIIKKVPYEELFPK